MSADLPSPSAPRAPRSRLALASFGVAAVLAFCLLLGLGTWQVQRLSWKQDLIARVDERLKARPVALPPARQWPQDAETVRRAEYARVRVAGRLLQDKTALVQASTRLGPGFWVLVPLARSDGGTVWINRGFVPPEARETLPRTGTPEVEVGGLIRVPEPGGSLLRRNDAAHDRWYSRDVAALSAARGIRDAAPYFLDEEAQPAGPEWPRGGLTVVAFPNNHLVYAITWYVLAAMVAAAAGYVLRDARRRRAAAATGGEGANA